MRGGKTFVFTAFFPLALKCFSVSTSPAHSIQLNAERIRSFTITSNPSEFFTRAVAFIPNLSYN